MLNNGAVLVLKVEAKHMIYVNDEIRSLSLIMYFIIVKVYLLSIVRESN